MEIDNDWMEEMEKVYPDLKLLKEGGHSYILIKELALPIGCLPSSVDALLCLDRRDGYDSRLYLSTKIQGQYPTRNWNSSIAILDRNWHGISWKTKPGLSYMEMLLVHLKAFR